MTSSVFSKGSRIRSAGGLSVANGVYALAQWVPSILILKTYGLEGVGTYFLGLSISAPIFLLLGFQLRAHRGSYSGDTYTFADYVSLRLTAGIVALAASVIVGLFVSRFMSVDPQFMFILGSIGLCKFFDSLSDVCCGEYQRSQVFSSYSKSLILRGVFTSLTLAAILITSGSLILALLGVATANFLIMHFVDLPKAQTLAQDVVKFRYDFKMLKQLTKSSWKLGLALLADSLVINSQRMMMPTWISVAQMGVYGLIVQLIVIPQIFFSALGQFFLPKIARNWDERPRTAVRITSVYVAITVALGFFSVLVTILFGEWILALIYDQELAQSAHVFTVVMIGGFFWYCTGPLGIFCLATKNFNTTLYLNTVALVCTVLCSSMIIPMLGIYGAAIALMVGFGVRCLLAMYFVLRIVLRRLKTTPAL